MYDRLVVGPGEGAVTRELSAFGETNAAGAEECDGELDRPAGVSWVDTRAVVDLLDGEVRHRINQSMAHLPHESPPAANWLAHI